MATAAETPTKLDVSAVVGAFVRIRDTRSELKKRWEAEEAELLAKQDRLGAVLLQHLKDQNANSVKTEHGTFYKQEEVKPNIVDDVAFYGFIKDQDCAADALERRAKKGFVTEFMANHEGLPPPGIAVSREYVVRVRRS
jgi:hypothetical protein